VTASASAVPAEKGGLRRKIWIAFILQMAAIGFATVLGVYSASVVLKDVLIKRALMSEAAHFWVLRAADPAAALPDTHNMRGYLLVPGAPVQDLPVHLRDLSPGYHAMPRSEGGHLVLVDERPAGRLYLLFKQSQVDKLAFYFGAVPLVLVLVVIYLIAWFGYRMSRRAVSPVSWLAGIVQRWDPKQPDVGSLMPQNLPSDVEGEVLVLASALHEFGTRIGRFIERERNFTRDASHELRTPLTVMRMACDLLTADDALSPAARRSVERIRAAGRDMESLIESFLMLAREGDAGLPEEDFVVNEQVREEVDKLRPLLAGRPISLRIEERASFVLHGPSRALSVIVSNLVRNACLYTERGEVRVIVEADRVIVEDTGPGISREDLARVFEPFFRAEAGRQGGHGIGLSIVLRLSERFGWRVTLDSEPGCGTRASIRFPQARPLPAVSGDDDAY